MIFKYGGYAHEDNEVALSFTQRAILVDRGIKAHRRIISLTGKLHGTDVDDLTDKIQSLQNAYELNGKDAVLYKSDGTTQTAIGILNSQTINGTRVTQPPTFGNLDGAEYTTFVTYSITIEGDVQGDTNLLAYEEKLSFRGNGGPRLAYLEPIVGEPIKQQTTQRTISKVIQSGRALGLSGYPTVNGPLFPGDEDGEQRGIDLDAPKNLLGYRSEFAIQWSYRFRSVRPLSGIPISR